MDLRGRGHAPGLASLLLLATATASGAAGADPYRILVNQVDASDFPEVRVEFQVYVQDPLAPAFQPGMGVAVSEHVRELDLGVRPAPDAGPAELCRENPVVLSVVLDIPDSVKGELPQIRSGAAEAFRRLGQGGAAGGYRAALYALAEVPKRFPETGFTEDLAMLSTRSATLEVGTGSPVWRNVAEETERLAAYQPTPAPGGAADEVVRVLALVADGTETTDEPPETNMLRIRAAALAAGVRVVTLGYGQVFEEPMQKVAGLTDGLFVNGVDQNVGPALSAVVDGASRTYCLRYRSPHTDVVNEVASLALTIGGSRGEAPYNLPFLVPEDTRQVDAFFAVPARVAAVGDPTPPPALEATLTLVEADGSPWEARGRPERPQRQAVVPVAPQDWTLVPEASSAAASGGWSGFVVRVPAELLRVPTEFLDPADTAAPVPHFRIAVGPAAGTAPGRRIVVTGLLSVQDRTAPAVRVRLFTDDGAAPQWVRVVEAPADRDPGFVRQARVQDETARTPGPGDKRVQASMRGRAADGSESRVTRDEVDGSIELAPHTGEARLLLWARSRARLEVLALDNFAEVAGSFETSDADVFLAGAVGAGGEPRYADPERGRLPNPGETPAAPFLPWRTRSELEGSARQAGVTWWVEAPGDPADPERQVEHREYLAYYYSDRRARRGAPEDGSALRVLRVRAQDGAGNVTDLRIPLRVEELGFSPRLVALAMERADVD